MGDLINLSFENHLTGDAYQAELTFEEAARLKRGQPVAFRDDRVRHWTLAERRAQLDARIDQIDARLAELKREHRADLRDRLEALVDENPEARDTPEYRRLRAELDAADLDELGDLPPAA